MCPGGTGGLGAAVADERGHKPAVGRTRSPIVEKENPLTHSPERRRAELVEAGISLAHEVGEAVAHLMDSDVAERVDGDDAHSREDRAARRARLPVPPRASHPAA